MKKLWWALSALVALAVIGIAYVTLSREVAIDSCLDAGGAWRDEQCVYR